MALLGWDSIESTTVLGNIFELGGLALFLIVIAFEFLAYLYAQRKDQLVDEAARAAASAWQYAEQEARQRHEAEIMAVRQQLFAADQKTSEPKLKKSKRKPSGGEV